MKKTNIIDFAKKSRDPVADRLLRNTAAMQAVAAGGAITDQAIADFESAIMDDILMKSNESRYSCTVLEDFFRGGNKFKFVDFESYVPNLILSRWQGDIVYYYCKNSKKGRLKPDIEQAVFASPYNRQIDNFGYKIARYVIRGKYPEYEKVCKNFRYVIFLKKKNLDLDSVLMNSSVLAFLYYRNYYHLPDDVHNYMVAMSLTTDYHTKKYFKIRGDHDRIIKNRLKSLDQTKTVSEVIKNMTSLGK